MKTIKKKLNSNSGVTILFAMLLFLVATVVSMVIIVAATSSVKRESSFKESVQKNIELDSCSIVLKSKFIGDVSFVDDNGVFKYSGPVVSDEFKKIMIDISTNIINNQTSPKYDGAFKITGDELSDINITCNINLDANSYRVSFTLDNGHIMYVYFNVELVNLDKLNWKYEKSSFKNEVSH